MALNLMFNKLIFVGRNFYLILVQSRGTQFFYNNLKMINNVK